MEEKTLRKRIGDLESYCSFISKRLDKLEDGGDMVNELEGYSTDDLIKELVRRGSVYGKYGLYQEYEIRKKYSNDKGESSIGDEGEFLILPLSGK